MMRIVYVMLMLTIPVTLSAAIDQRIEWWTVYIDNVTTSMETVRRDEALAGPVVPVMERDLARAQLFLRELKAERDGAGYAVDTPLGYDSVNRIIDETALPLFYAAYLDLFVGGVTNDDNISMVKNSIRKALQGMAETYGIDVDDFMQGVMNNVIDSDTWKQLSMEFFAGSMILSMEKTRDEIVAEIARNVHEDLAGKKYFISRSGAQKIVVSHTDTALSGHNMVTRLGNFDQSLIRSPAWKRLMIDIDMLARRYVELRSSVNEVAVVTFEQYTGSGGSVYFLDGAIMGPKTLSDAAQLSVSDTDVKKTSRLIPLLAIPPAIPTDKVYANIDQVRKKYLKLVHFGNSIDMDQVSRELNRVVAQSFEQIGIVYENESVRAESGKIQFTNEQEFLLARDYFNRQWKMAAAYAQLSIAVIDSSRGELVPGRTVLAARSREIYDAEREHLDFINQLFREILPCSELVHPLVHRKFDRNSKKVGILIESLSSGLTLTRAEQGIMDRETLGEIMSMRRDLAHGRVALRRKVQSIHGRYFAAYGRKQQQRRVDRDSINEIMAQREIDLVLETAEEYAELFLSLSYDELFLARYRTLYTEIAREAEGGHETPRLVSVIRNLSLLTSMDEGNLARLEGEMKTRNFARQQALTALQRITSLETYYRGRGILLQNGLPVDDMRQIRSTFGPGAAAVIDSWKVHAGNIAEVDRKAALKLRDIYHRALAGKPEASGAEIMTLSWGSLNLDYRIPRGWNKLGDFTGTVRHYHAVTYADMKGEQRIRLSIEEFDRSVTGIDALSKNYFARNGMSVVTSRWGARDSFEYYWARGKGQDDQIVELYTFRHGEYIIHVEGNGSRMTYGVLRDRLKTVMESLRL